MGNNLQDINGPQPNVELMPTNQVEIKNTDPSPLWQITVYKSQYPYTLDFDHALNIQPIQEDEEL